MADRNPRWCVLSRVLGRSTLVVLALAGILGGCTISEGFQAGARGDGAMELAGKFDFGLAREDHPGATWVTEIGGSGIGSGHGGLIWRSGIDGMAALKKERLVIRGGPRIGLKLAGGEHEPAHNLIGLTASITRTVHRLQNQFNDNAALLGVGGYVSVDYLHSGWWTPVTEKTQALGGAGTGPGEVAGGPPDEVTVTVGVLITFAGINFFHKPQTPRY